MVEVKFLDPAEAETTLASATGTRKKHAEQEAARLALQHLRIQPPDFELRKIQARDAGRKNPRRKEKMTGETEPSLDEATCRGAAVPAAPAPVRIPHHHEVLILIQTTLTFLVSALFVLTFIAQPYRIPSGSMEDTLLIGDFLLVNKVIFANPGPWKPLLAYEPVQHDDIVVFHYPIDASMYLVKRVIGVPGDEVHLHRGLVYLDGRCRANRLRSTFRVTQIFSR